MGKYTGIDTKKLTLEDALNDPDFDKQPNDYFKYLTLERPILQSIVEDFTPEEVKRFMYVLALYFIDGIEPDYNTIDSGIVKQAVRITIENQKERLLSLYVTHYRQFVGAIQRREQQDFNPLQET